MPISQKENLFVVAMEECAEVSKELSKCLRFGIDNHKPGYEEMLNKDCLGEEYAQLCGMMERIFKENNIEINKSSFEAVKAYKNSKVDAYYDETVREGI